MRSVGGPPPVPAAAGVNLLRSPAPGGGGGREGEGENPAARTRAAGEAGGFARGRGQVDPPPPVGPRADSGTTSTAERAPRGGRPGAKGQGPRPRSRGDPGQRPDTHARDRDQARGGGAQPPTPTGAAIATRRSTTLRLDALRAAKQAAAGWGPAAPHGRRPLSSSAVLPKKEKAPGLSSGDPFG